MKRSTRIQLLKIIGFIMLVLVYTGFLFMVKYMSWPGVSIVAAVMARNTYKDVNRLLTRPIDAPKEEEQLRLRTID